MKNHYFQMDDRALWSELRSGSLIALEVYIEDTIHCFSIMG